MPSLPDRRRADPGRVAAAFAPRYGQGHLAGVITLWEHTRPENQEVFGRYRAEQGW